MEVKVSILGTGSNCSYYDGKEIHQKVTSLGYVLMDDASGNYFGRQLLRDYYFNKLSKELETKFKDELLINTYFLIFLSSLKSP